jgi:hypothetical protein
VHQQQQQQSLRGQPGMLLHCVPPQLELWRR